MEHGEERLVVTNKPEEEGAKIRKLPRLDPSFLPFSVFFDGATNLFLVVVAHFLVFGRKRNRSAQRRVGDAKGSEVTAVRPATVLRRAEGLFSRSLGHGQAEGERGRFIFLDNTPDSPSSLPIAICPYFCPDHQKGYRRFGGFNP